MLTCPHPGAAGDGSVAHVCARKAAVCWQHRHQVRLGTKACEAEVNAFEDWETEQYDGVLLRHGPVADTPKLARQMLPYGLAWPRDLT